MRVESQTLVGGVRTPFHIPGRFFLLIQASTGIEVEFRRNKSLLREKATNVVGGYKSFPGDWSDPDDNTFDEFVLTSANAQTIIYGVSQSAGDYSFLRTLVQLEQPDTVVGGADATIGIVESTPVPANAARRSITLRALKSNTARIRIAEVGALIGTEIGMYLDAGDAITLETTSAIAAIATAIDQELAIFEEQKGGGE